jgi:hypothetical protein
VILENPTLISNTKVREKIETHRQTVVSNHEMVRLDDHLDLPVPWRSLEIRPRWDELLCALRDCEFRSLVREIEKEAALAGFGPPPPPKQGELF